MDRLGYSGKILAKRVKKVRDKIAKAARARARLPLTARAQHAVVPPVVPVKGKFKGICPPEAYWGNTKDYRQKKLRRTKCPKQLYQEPDGTVVFRFCLTPGIGQEIRFKETDWLEMNERLQEACSCADVAEVDVGAGASCILERFKDAVLVKDDANIERGARMWQFNQQLLEQETKAEKKRTRKRAKRRGKRRR